MSVLRMVARRPTDSDLDWLDSQALDARTANVAHLRATDSMAWRHFSLGAFAAVLSAVVASAGFATIHKTEPTLRLVLAGLVMFAAAMSALQTYMRYGQRAEQHRAASRSYGNAVREIALAREQTVTGDLRGSALEAQRKAIEQVLASADKAAPNVPPFIWAWAVASVTAVHATAPAEIPDDRIATTLNRGLWPRIIWQFFHYIPAPKVHNQLNRPRR